MRCLRSEKEIMKNWKGDVSKPLVSICCITYNHEAYIEDALEGFLIQETDFPFEILIHDDASIDGTADIIREYEAEYSNLIKPIYQKENQYSKRVDIFKTFLYPRAKGEYIAVCEGDDYWTDPNKLQLQAQFLLSNLEYGFVHTNHLKIYQETGQITLSRKANPPSGWVFNKLLIKNFISTLTVMYRKQLAVEAARNLNTWMDKNLKMDYSFWLELSRLTKMQYLDNITAMYRISPGTASRPVDPYAKSLWIKKRFDIVCSFVSRYDIQEQVVQDFYQDFFDTYLERLHKYNKFYQFSSNQLAGYFPISLRFRVLKYLHVNQYPRSFYFFWAIPFYMIRKIKSLFSRLI